MVADCKVAGGLGRGATSASGGSGAGFASYGGAGAGAAGVLGTVVGGAPYGLLRGGNTACGASVGGLGGGRILVKGLKSIKCEGTIGSRGAASTTCAGGGSGGGIMLDTRDLYGAGSVLATGGAASLSTAAGAGSGGRIHLNQLGTHRFTGTMTTRVGAPQPASQASTVLFDARRLGRSYLRAFVDGSNFALATATYYPFNETESSFYVDELTLTSTVALHLVRNSTVLTVQRQLGCAAHPRVADDGRRSGQHAQFGIARARELHH